MQFSLRVFVCQDEAPAGIAASAQPVYTGDLSVISCFLEEGGFHLWWTWRGERGWRENVCLFNSEPAPILRSRAGMWVGFVCFHPVLALRIHCFGPMSLSVKMLCCEYDGYAVYFTLCEKHILMCWYMCELQMCICLCVCCVCVRKHLLTETQGVASCSRDRTGP